MTPKRTTRSTPATSTTTTTTHMTNDQLKALINQGVVDALAARDADRSRNGKDSHDSGTGVRRQDPPARECTYQDFKKCKPLHFKGTEGVVELTQWFERMETVFRISNYTVKNQIKFATCTLLGSALTWWNSHAKIVGPDVAYAMTWTNLKKKMADKYCPRGEIKKLEVELWNLKVKGTDVSDKIERYIGGLPDMIHESVMASKPNTIQDAIEFTTEPMDKKISTFVEHQAENKKKSKIFMLRMWSLCTFQEGVSKSEEQKRGNQGGNGNAPVKVYAVGNARTNPGALRQVKNLHVLNVEPCTFQEGVSKAEEQKCGNQGGNGNAPTKVYAVGHARTNPDSNVVTGLSAIIDNEFEV
nr:hypothetical protein [Tanacetum cinerariifolium]